MFTDTLEAQTGERASLHPADMLLDAFKDATKAADTMQKMRTFLEEALKMHGSKLDESPILEGTWFSSCN